MVANALLVTIAILLRCLLWLLGELKFLASCEGIIFHACGNIVLGGCGLTKPREAHRRALDQQELTAEILSL